MKLSCLQLFPAQLLTLFFEDNSEKKVDTNE